MAKGKKSFILYSDLRETFKHLTMEQRGLVITWVLDYVCDDNPEPLDGLLAAVCEPIRLQLKRDLEKWDSIRIKRSDAGKKSAAKRAQQKATNPTSVKSVEQKATNPTVTDNVNVTVNDSVSVNGTVNETDNAIKEKKGFENPDNSLNSELEENSKRKKEKSSAQKEKDNLINQAIDQIIQTLSNSTGRGFQVTTQSYRDLIRARLKDGLLVHDLKDMIIYKCTEWFGTDMEKYLRPETLFQKSKCQGYVDTMNQYKANPNNGAFKEIKGKAIEQNTEQILAEIEKQLEKN